MFLNSGGLGSAWTGCGDNRIYEPVTAACCVFTCLWLVCAILFLVRGDLITLLGTYLFIYATYSGDHF